MTDQHRPGSLAPIYARLAYLERRERRRRLPRRALPAIVAVLLVALVPLATLAANPFVDLTGGPHDGNIDAIYNAGITRGCNPPDNTQYCPTRTVTREEMASFLARAAGLGGNPPIANAATAITAQNAVNATNAANAGNAGTVGGLAPGELTRAAAGRGTATLSASYTTVAAARVVAPRAGYIVATATAYAFGCNPTCTATLRLYDATAGAARGMLVAQRAELNTFGALGNTWVFPVAAGPRDIAAQLSTSTGDGSGEAAITLVFTPYADTPAGGFEAGVGQPQPRP